MTQDHKRCSKLHSKDMQQNFPALQCNDSQCRLSSARRGGCRASSRAKSFSVDQPWYLTSLTLQSCRGLDTCPETKRRLTSSRLASNEQLKRQVLTWLKGKKDALQAQAAAQAMQQTPQAAAAGSRVPQECADAPGCLNDLIRRASTGLDAAAAAAAADGITDGVTCLSVHQPTAAAGNAIVGDSLELAASVAAQATSMAPSSNGGDLGGAACGALAKPAPRPVASVFSKQWATQDSVPEPAAAPEPELDEQAKPAEEHPPQPAQQPQQQQPAARPVKSIFASRWTEGGGSSASAEPAASSLPDSAAAQQVVQQPGAAAALGGGSQQAAGEPRMPVSIAWLDMLHQANRPTPPATPMASPDAGDSAAPGGGSFRITRLETLEAKDLHVAQDGATVNKSQPTAEPPGGGDPQATSVTSGVAGESVAPQAAAELPGQPGTPQQQRPASPPAASPLPHEQQVQAPQPQHSGSWAEPVSTYSYYSEQRQSSYEMSLATVAAAQQRWGNQSR